MDKTPAFPMPMDARPDAPFAAQGMMLRDYFAAHAIQGILANQKYPDSNSEMARWAYGIADAMMEERND
jgi:hypothetical protein